MSSRLPETSTSRLALVVLFLAALAAAAALHWPLPMELDSSRVHAHFHGSHVWCFDHIFAMLTGSEPFEHHTRRIGFPENVQLRFIAWVPALLSAPLRLVLGPLGAYNVVLLLSPAISALAAWLLIRRITAASPFTCAGAALAFALSPYVMGCLANGQIAKIQLWILPLHLWAMSVAIRGPKPWKGWCALPLVTIAAAFTSPSTTLFIPIAAALLLPWEIAAASKWRRASLLAVGALLLTGLSLLPAKAYFSGLRSTEVITAFSPGTPPPHGDILDPSIVAQPEETFLTQARRDPSASQSHHVTYLGLPILLVVCVLSWRGFAGRGLGVTWLLGGTVLAMGPYLASQGALVQISGREIPLPALLLEWVQYPLASSGMYYRGIQIATLGIALLIAGSAQRFGNMRAVLLAWILGSGLVFDGWRVTSTLLPRNISPVEGEALLEAMAEDPTPGAVLDLPLDVDPYTGGLYMVAAVVHRRPTTGLPRQSRVAHLPHLARLDRVLQAGLEAEPGDLSSQLQSMGFRYVAWHRRLDSNKNMGEKLGRALGESTEADNLMVWRLGEPLD